jgi:hypothetical protein
LPAPAADHARASLALASRLGPRVAHSADAAFIDGFQYALLGGAAAVVLAAIGVLLLHRR